jgi:hypothetical protein
MKTPKTTVVHAASRAVFFAIIFGLMGVPVFAQKREYKEAHVFVTAPATDTTPAQLLDDCGFQAFAPLEQPNEHGVNASYFTLMFCAAKAARMAAANSLRI